MNNPLAYTDPSGPLHQGPLAAFAGQASLVSVWLPGAGFWTGTTLFAANGVGAVAVSGFVAGAVTSGNLKGAVLGAFNAAAFHGVGTLFEGRFLPASGEGVLGTGMNSLGVALKSGAHGLAGGVMGALQGGRFGHGFLSGFATQLAAGRIDGLERGAQRVAAAAALGGTVSAVTGGKFANGAVTGAFSRAFNDEMHRARERARERAYRERLGAFIDKYEDILTAGGIDLSVNIAEAKRISLLEFAEKLMSADGWDYKHNEALVESEIDPKRLADFGNEHYGLVAAARGLSGPTTAQAAGAVQVFLQSGGSLMQLLAPYGLALPHPSAPFMSPDLSDHPMLSPEATQRWVEAGGTFGDNPGDSAAVLRGWRVHEGP